ncbi:MAG: CopD family protein [Gammaproteobacteria bacterium]|nr:CopD family protein [Gammaproteobacteria bacterium]
MPFAIALHILAAVIWVGGMFFAYMALRPVAASLLEPPLRLPLWSQTFARFFPWVWAAVLLLPLTGYWMILVPFEGFANAGGHIHLMQITGWAMIAIFLHLYFAPYRRLRQAVVAQDWPEGVKQLALIRKLVGINLMLGVVTVVIATGGAYFAGYLASLND